MDEMLRRSFVALALGLMVGACTTPSNARVSGVVTIGPTCGVVSCPDRPVPNIRIIFVGTSTQSPSAVTDSSGAYSLALAPGDYDVTLNGPNPLVFQVITALPPPSFHAKIHTSSGQELRVNFRLFSAIAQL